MADIHWFPGHMNKALNEINESVKKVDVIIEVLDARIPFSSINEEFDKTIQNKKILYVYTKADLADPKITSIWKEKLAKANKNFVILDLNKDNVNQIISKKINELGKEKHQKEISKGMKPQPIRTMIIGIPNVGKSSLINRLANRKAAGVSNRPGFTRGEQMIKVNNDFFLLDTPGVLPMSYENKKKAIHLALTGAIKEDILPEEFLATSLLNILKEKYPFALKERFDIEEITDYSDIMNKICMKRAFKTNGGELDIARATSLLLKEFKEGILGRFSLED